MYCLSMYNPLAHTFAYYINSLRNILRLSDSESNMILTFLPSPPLPPPIPSPISIGDYRLGGGVSKVVLTVMTSPVKDVLLILTEV